jgi:hypothetical protein
MDTIDTPETEPNFGVEIAQAFAVSLATTAGAFAGMILIGAVYGKVQQRKAAKNAKTKTED